MTMRLARPFVYCLLAELYLFIGLEIHQDMNIYYVLLSSTTTHLRFSFQTLSRLAASLLHSLPRHWIINIRYVKSCLRLSHCIELPFSHVGTRGWYLIL